MQTQSLFDQSVIVSIAALVDPEPGTFCHLELLYPAETKFSPRFPQSKTNV